MSEQATLKYPANTNNDFQTASQHDETRQGEALVIGAPQSANGRKLFIESYGCAMNFSDSEIVASFFCDFCL